MSRNVFDESEYERRVDRTKARLREADLDAIVVADPANVNYLTGYDGWSFYVHQAVVVTAERDDPVWIGPLLGRSDGHRGNFGLFDVCSRPYYPLVQAAQRSHEYVDNR